MPNMLTNILGGIQRIAKEFKPWVPDYQGGPPLNRDVTVGFAHLERVAADGTKVSVGAFLPEHYVLAEAGSLRCQILEKEWQAEREGKKLSITADDLKKDRPDLYQALYREENNKAVRKTAFELAILRSESLTKIEHFIEKEYTFLKDRQLPIPAMVSKYRIQPDFLTNIADAGLVIKGVDNRKVNIHNPNPSKREKILHYAAQALATVTTAVAAVGIIEVLMLMGVASPLAIGAGVVAGYLGKKRGADFGFYDLAEGLHRDTLWATSRKFITGKFSLSKTIITSMYIACIAMLTTLAVMGAFSGALALPFALLAKAGLGASAMTAIQTGFAGILAAVAGIGAVMGMVYPIRYFDTFSCYDNEIAVTKAMGDALPAVNTAKDFNAKLAATQDKLLAKVDNPKYGFSEAERLACKGEIITKFSGLQKSYGAHPVPTPDASKEPRRSPRKHSPAKQ